MPYTPFTRSEVKLILQLSELGTGHAGERHSKATNAYLAERQLRGTPTATAFLNFEEMIDAGLALLNAPANDAAIERFRVEKRQGKGYPGSSEKYVALEHRLTAPIKMRYAIGGTTRTFPCTKVKMVIDKCNGRPRNMHVVTFFGEFG
ncbi:MAG: hypothetical protein AAGE86_03805 [Pseudomonadota bacterium]